MNEEEFNKHFKHASQLALAAHKATSSDLQAKLSKILEETNDNTVKAVRIASLMDANSLELQTDMLKFVLKEFLVTDSKN